MNTVVKGDKYVYLGAGNEIYRGRMTIGKIYTVTEVNLTNHIVYFKYDNGEEAGWNIQVFGQNPKVPGYFKKVNETKRNLPNWF